LAEFAAQINMNSSGASLFIMCSSCDVLIILTSTGSMNCTKTTGGVHVAQTQCDLVMFQWCTEQFGHT